MRIYTEKDLAEMGYIEVAPGIFERVKPAIVDQPKKKKLPAHLAHIKSGNYQVGGKTYHFRSKYEYTYCQYLHLLQTNGSIRSYEYESENCRFNFPKIKKGTNSFLIDFRVVENDGSHYFVEVKGWLDKKSATKLRRFAKYYPNEKLVLVRKEEITAIRKSGILGKQA